MRIPAYSFFRPHAMMPLHMLKSSSRISLPFLILLSWDENQVMPNSEYTNCTPIYRRTVPNIVSTVVWQINEVCLFLAICAGISLNLADMLN